MRHDMKLPYEVHNGPVDSPTRLADFYLYQARVTGRTNKLIETLPDDKPIYVLVHSHQYGKAIMHSILDKRPDFKMGNVKFISYKSFDELANQTAGDRRPIYVDNAVLDMIQLDFVRSINNVFGPLPQKDR